ncbi:MAG: hypothetical protein Q9200_001278 [Gallowayella weberi]
MADNQGSIDTILGPTSFDDLEKSWVIYAHGAWIDKSMQLTPLQKLIPHIAQPLWDHDLFEIAADCWTELLNTCPPFFTPENLVQLVGFLTSQRANNLMSLLIKGDYEADAVAFSRLLLAYSDVSIQDLAKHPESPSVQILMRFLIQLLAYEGFAGVEDDICTPTVEFWQAYTEYLIDSTAENQMEPWMNDARQYVVEVVEQCWRKIRMPPQEVYAEWNSDAKGEFKVFRTDVVDLLQSAYVLLGTSLFDRFTNLALEALQNHAWLHLEATLFCLNALAESISGDDVVDATLSALFGSELFPSMMNDTLGIPYSTQQTAVTIITSFTAFFERHTQYLPAMLTFLFNSVRTSALAGVAAKAIQSTCDSCRHSLVWEVSTFLQQYDNLLLWEDLETVAKERIIGAIAAIVQAIPSEKDKLESISKLLDFVEQDVQACLELAKNDAPVGAEEKGLCALSCLISMGKYLEEPDDKTIDLEFKPPGQDELYMPTIWTPFQQRIAHNMNAVGKALGPDNGAVVEAICQVFRTGFKENFPGPFVFGPNFIEDYITSTNLHTPRLDYALSTAGAMLSAHSRAGTTMINRSATRFLIHLFQLIAEMGCKSFPCGQA